MTDKPKGPSKKEIKAKNLAALKERLEQGARDGDLPLKADRTIKRDEIATECGFARSAFQKTSKTVDGKRVRVESEFAIMVDEYDQKIAGKSGSEWGGKAGGGGSDQEVRELKSRVQKLEQRKAVLALELDEANAKLDELGYRDAELDEGSVRLPW